MAIPFLSAPAGDALDLGAVRVPTYLLVMVCIKAVIWLVDYGRTRWSR